MHLTSINYLAISPQKNRDKQKVSRTYDAIAERKQIQNQFSSKLYIKLLNFITCFINIAKINFLEPINRATYQNHQQHRLGSKEATKMTKFCNETQQKSAFIIKWKPKKQTSTPQKSYFKIQIFNTFLLIHFLVTKQISC